MAEGYIAISQFREDKRKQKVLEEHGYFGTSNQSQKQQKAHKFMHTTKEIDTLGDDMKVSYSHHIVNSVI